MAKSTYYQRTGVNGFIVESNDSEEFYKRLVQLIDNTNLRTSFGNNLYQTIIENHSEEGVIAKYLNWVNSLN